jgi:hypothetical protein
MRCHLKTLAGAEYELERIIEVYKLGSDAGFCISGFPEGAIECFDTYVYSDDNKLNTTNIYGHRGSNIEFTTKDGKELKYSIKIPSNTIMMLNQVQLALSLENV